MTASGQLTDVRPAIEMQLRIAEESLASARVALSTAYQLSKSAGLSLHGHVYWAEDHVVNAVRRIEGAREASA